jgi:beta-galactosidase/beta-glucuronidase
VQGWPQPSDVEIRLVDAAGEVRDRVTTYVGMREVAVDGHRVLLNGKPVFQRLVLDQGYWPDTLMTAPSAAALEADIRLAMEAGFNGARVHQKVAEEEYLYLADRLGYLVWGEFADWGASGQGPADDNHRPTPTYITQWAEVLERDFNHPSIIGWCPLNETYQVKSDRITVLDDVTIGMHKITKLIDPTRPVIDASGYAHRVPDVDIWDSHDYEQDADKFEANHRYLQFDRPWTNVAEDGRHYSNPYAGQPYMVSEFGGIWWSESEDVGPGDDREASWGYGQRVQTIEEFYQRFSALIHVLECNPMMFGYCYTQLTDVFQEHNGLYDFDRKPKFDIARILDAQSQKPAYENASGLTAGNQSSSTRSSD